jgi:hypothetical protein
MNGIAFRRASRFATLILPTLVLSGCFFGEGSGPVPIPGTPAPPVEPPPEGFCDVINFEDVCGDFDFIDPNSGEPGFEGGVTLVIDNPDIGGLNTTEKVAQMQKFGAESGFTFGGSTLQRPNGVDFAQGEAFTMLVWASREVPVLFKLDSLAEERSVDHSGSGTWEELCFDFTGVTSGAPTATTITFIFDVDVLGDATNNPSDWTFFFDEITLVENCGGGGGGAQVGLPVTFDDAAVDYDLVDFGDPVPAATTLIADPTDAGNTVASTNKPPGTPVWAGTTVGGTGGLAAAVPFTATETTMTVRVYSPDAGIPVRLKVEDAADDTISVETEALTTVANQWETLTFDFSVQAAGTAALDIANTYDKASIFFNFGTDGDTAGDKTYLWDDLAFGGAGAGGNAPVVAAPTPTQDAANVISLYSDAYVDIAVTWPTTWSNPNNTTSDVTIDGGLTKEHLGVDFIGVEFASLDVSGMTHFHMDIWSPDIETLTVKIVDFGGDGFGNNNDTEGPIVFDGAAGNQPTPAQGQWVSLDISLADMQAAGLGSLLDINQLVFAVTPAGATTIYVDNVYFYNDNAGAGGGGGELLANGDMEAGQDPWIGQATVIDDGGNNVLQGVVTNPDPNQPFLVNASQVVELTDGETYTLTFRARAAQARNMIAGLGLNEAPFTANIETVPLTTEWQAFTYTITTAGVGGANSRVLFDMNGEAGDVFIDDVSLTLGSLLTNGNMEAGQDPWIGQATVIDDGGNNVLQGLVPNPDPNQPFLVNASQVIELTDGETYVLTFKARATQAKSILAGLGLNEAPWTANIETVPLTTEWQTFTYTITTAGVGIANSRVLFDMNGEPGDVFIDDVALAVLGPVGGGGNTGGGGGDGNFVNGDFETGDFTGWTPELVPPERGSITLDSSGQGGRAGTVARLQAAGDAAGTNDALLSQVALGAGTISPGDTISVSFDLYGSLTGAGGVVFVEVIFLDANGDDVGGRDFVGPAAPYEPTAAWTPYSGTVIAGTATGGGQFDVSGGVTLQLKAACGAIVNGCGVDASFDNVTFVIN